MRHGLANVVAAGIAALLISAAGLFAWARSAQLALSDESTVVSRFEPAPAHEFVWAELGAGSYQRNCGNCHGTQAQGRDQYPPLRHVWSLLLAPGGREYLTDVHIYGLSSRRRRVPMPPMGHVPDVELAAVINHVIVHLADEQLPDTVELLLPQDVRGRRGQRLTPRQVSERRPGSS